MSDYIKILSTTPWNASDKWIPIEEGMPCELNDSSECVLVTFVEPDFVLDDPNDGPEYPLDVTKAYYEEGTWYEFRTQREIAVVAWMPLPKDYIPNLKTTLRAIAFRLRNEEEEDNQ